MSILKAEKISGIDKKQEQILPSPTKKIIENSIEKCPSNQRNAN